MYAQRQISHPISQRDFLAFRTMPVSVLLAMECVGCSFDSFSVFLLSLKQQNLMQIMFSCIHFPVWPYPPQNNDIFLFYTGKLYGLTGMTNAPYVCGFA